MADTADGGENGDGVLDVYHWNGTDGSPSLAVVDALAELRDAAPTSLESLYNTVDPDALDRLCKNSQGSKVVVEFRRSDFIIAVTDNGEITIRDADDSEQ